MSRKGSSKEPRRVPGWFMLPVGMTVGFLVASWPGAVFGGVLGAFLWWSRR